MFEYLIGFGVLYFVGQKIAIQEYRPTQDIQHYPDRFWGPNGKLRQDEYVRDDLLRDRKKLAEGWTLEEANKMFGSIGGDLVSRYGPQSVEAYGNDRSGAFDFFRGQKTNRVFHVVPSQQNVF